MNLELFRQHKLSQCVSKKYTNYVCRERGMNLGRGGDAEYDQNIAQHSQKINNIFKKSRPLTFDIIL